MYHVPDKAISIKQPWAWLIVNGFKDIENRTWKTSFRGSVFVHAGLAIDKKAAWDLDQGRHPVTQNIIDRVDPLYEACATPWEDELGGLVGIVDIVGCAQDTKSEWYIGPEYDGKQNYGFILENARAIAFMPMPGALSFFDWRKRLA